MKFRKLGKTGFEISEISLADQILNLAIDSGINFIDTADVYSNGLSEKAIGMVIRNRCERVFIATNLVLKWILKFEEVSCIIPGDSASEQVLSNLNALDLHEITTEEMLAVKNVYDTYIFNPVHYKW